jgi:hypothetical protein
VRGGTRVETVGQRSVDRSANGAPWMSLPPCPRRTRPSASSLTSAASLPSPRPSPPPLPPLRHLPPLRAPARQSPSSTRARAMVRRRSTSRPRARRSMCSRCCCSPEQIPQPRIGWGTLRATARSAGPIISARGPRSCARAIASGLQRKHRLRLALQPREGSCVARCPDILLRSPRLSPRLPALGWLRPCLPLLLHCQGRARVGYADCELIDKSMIDFLTTTRLLLAARMLDWYSLVGKSPAGLGPSDFGHSPSGLRPETGPHHQPLPVPTWLPPL